MRYCADETAHLERGAESNNPIIKVKCIKDEKHYYHR
jgi:hypothetical protein